MTHALLVGIAALFLATGAAHATETYQCGDVTAILRATPQFVWIAFCNSAT
jgi:hypothetical protein